MAEFVTGVIDPPHLLGFVRANAILQPPTLESILPTVNVDDIAYELDQIGQSLTEMASYRAWDTKPRLGRRAGFAQVRGELAPIGLSYRLNETEVKRLNRLRNGGASAEANTSLRRIYDDGLNSGNAVLAREEAARADLLMDGIVTIVENGVNAPINFGVPGAQIVTAAIPWATTGTATPLTNLAAWQAIYRGNNGGRIPGAWVTSGAQIANLNLNAEVRGALAANGTTPAFATLTDVNNVLRIRGIAPIVQFDGMLPDANGVATPTLATNKVIGIRQGMGNTLRTTAPAAELMVARGLIQASVAPGLITYVLEFIQPASVTTTTESVSLPVLRDPNALFVATV